MVRQHGNWRGVTARAGAATLGAYALVWAAVAAAARLPLPPADAILYPALAAIPAHVGLAIWAFAARSVGRVWLIIAAGCAGCWAMAWGAAA
ncbi:iron transporter [Achromobacter aegrifaciens]|uniref:iron transporter n=1 Tax=Achromobacter aegrifaciens TaxID=1287736 RepID=UPI000F7353D5|nr:iron transporter [Achromobacter aegrifaciens]RSF04446.1 iron transporter [Achromobacter aegrifaciens]